MLPCIVEQKTGSSERSERQNVSSTRNDPQETILVVDDEDEIVQFVQDALEDEGYAVWTAFDGATAVKEAKLRHPDLVILDIMLPGCDGFAVCKELREDLDIPILFLSAKQSDADKVWGFSVGADDYVMKPFSIKELIARVQAHLRRQRRAQTRNQQARQATQLRSGELTVDLGTHEVRYAGSVLALTRKEFEIIQGAMSWVNCALLSMSCAANCRGRWSASGGNRRRCAQ